MRPLHLFKLILWLCAISLATPATLAMADALADARAAHTRGDFKKEVELIRLAAEQGDALAQNALGTKYIKGEGVPQDDTEAIAWYRKAADQGLAGAQYNLGLAYGTGRGVPQDDKVASTWYRKAAEQGNDFAQLNLGISYAKGTGVPQDYTEALAWLQKAANQGNASAPYLIGYTYFSGNGVVRDLDEAEKWFRLAAAKGDPRAQDGLRAIENAPEKLEAKSDDKECQSYGAKVGSDAYVQCRISLKTQRQTAVDSAAREKAQAERQQQLTDQRARDEALQQRLALKQQRAAVRCQQEMARQERQGSNGGFFGGVLDAANKRQACGR